MPLIKDVARRDAKATLDDHWDKLFPVDPAYIAMKLGLKVFEADLDDVSGLLIKRPGEKAEIYLNAREPEERQNFTCAHELGHFVERKKSGDAEYSFRDERGARWAPSDSREWYAEHFAANLLMPLAHFDRQVDRGSSVSQLSNFFGVSRAAVRTRARGLNLSVWG